MLLALRLTCEDVALKRWDLPPAPSGRQAVCGALSLAPRRCLTGGRAETYRAAACQCAVTSHPGPKPDGRARRPSCLLHGGCSANHVQCAKPHTPAMPVERARRRLPCSGVSVRNNLTPRHGAWQAGTSTQCLLHGGHSANHVQLRSGRASCEGSPPPPQRPGSRIHGCVGWTSAGGGWRHASMGMGMARYHAEC